MFCCTQLLFALMSLFQNAIDLEKSGQSFALCTVVKVSGSTPQKISAKMIVVDNGTNEGTIFGTIGGGAIEHLVRQEAVKCIKEERSHFLETSLKNDLGMCCGGVMTVFIDLIKAKPSLICFGAGHIAKALCPLASQLGFLVSVVDTRRDLLSSPAFLDAHSRYDDISRFSLSDMPFSTNTYVVIATHDHALDQEVAENILAHPFKYASLVGSKRKAIMTSKRLRAKGFSNDAIERILCPAGLTISAKTPQEIAISIAAQMIVVKNGGPKIFGVDSGSGQQQPHGN